MSPEVADGHRWPDSLAPADAAYLTTRHAADPQEKQGSFDVSEGMTKIVNVNRKQEDKP